MKTSSDFATRSAEFNKKLKKKKPTILKEFDEFINRGNVVDLAVGVIVGSAFSGIVKSLVDDIIMPILGLIIGGVDFSKLTITIPNIFGSPDSATIAYGSFLQNVVNFFVIAFCIFLFIRFINKLSRNKKDAAAAATKKASDKAEVSSTEILSVLKDIRTELKKK